MQVHSRNFHVAFDLSHHGSLGYCLPDWCPLQPGSAAEAALTRLGCATSLPATATTTAISSGAISLRTADASTAEVTVLGHGSTLADKGCFLYGTAIVLPLRQDMTGAAAAAVAPGGGGVPGERGAVLRRRFADLSPTLLLFLQRLKRIVVRDEVAAAQLNGELIATATAGPGAVGMDEAAVAVVTAATRDRGSGDGGSNVARVIEMERRRVPGRPHLVQLLVTTMTTASTTTTPDLVATAAIAGGGCRGTANADSATTRSATATTSTTVTT